MFTYDVPTLSEIRSGPNIGSAIRRNTFDALGGIATNDRIYLFGSNFGDTASLLKINIMDKQSKEIQPCTEPKYHGNWISENGNNGYWMDDLRHPWSNPGLPYLSCVPPISSVGEKNIVLTVASQNVTYLDMIAGRCSEGFYGKLHELCVECWHFLNTELSSGAETVDSDKKIYADGLFCRLFFPL